MWYLFAVTEKKVARVFECLCELDVSFFFFWLPLRDKNSIQSE